MENMRNKISYLEDSPKDLTIRGITEGERRRGEGETKINPFAKMFRCIRMNISTC